jgi:poly(ribitol-phosphate) beta-N-acetylglucosaminyltransferase
VSVIVPIYNPGPYLDECVGSILAQSLGPDRVEAILVDDGSTDDSPAKLDEWARRHANIRVIHQENSGWPGKPRNVGIAAARGRFVFFLDHDDRLAPEALERLVAMAERNDSDIVLGRMAGFHRSVPRDLFYEDRDRASIHDAGLMNSLTPHKLFRRSFVAAHALRFPEGRRRLEDLPFVIRAYFLAANVSVLSRYICYYHVRRDDRSNAGLQRFDPVGYYRNLRESADIIQAHTEPGPARDRLLRRFVVAELLGRLTDRRLLDQPEDYRSELFREIRAFTEERIPRTLQPTLAPLQHVQLELVRHGRLDLLEHLAEIGVGTVGEATLHDIRHTDDRVLLDVEMCLAHDGVPVIVRSDGGDQRLDVPATVADAVGEGACRLGVGPLGTARVFLRKRDDWAELVGPPVDIVAESKDATATVGVRSMLMIDLLTASAGDPIWPGTWDAFVRIAAVGYSRDVRLGAQRAWTGERRFAARRVGRHARLWATPYWTKGANNLSFQVTDRPPPSALRRIARAILRRIVSR